MIKYLGIDHYSVWVRDLALSKDFYANVLGLEEIERPDFGFPGVWFSIGTHQQLHLIAGNDQQPISGSRKNHVAISVASVQDAYQQLAPLDIITAGPKQRPDGHWQLFIVDPDGYHIEFTSIDS